MTKRDSITILFSSAGRRVALMNNFRKAAKILRIHANIIAVDMDPSWSPACEAADVAFAVPRCTAADFMPQMLDICRKQKVDLIIPTIDTELMPYVTNKDKFTKIGVDIHIGDARFVATARDKEETVRLLKSHNIPVPASWDATAFMDRKEEVSYPLLIKPKGGSCSKGISIVSSAEEMQAMIEGQNNLLIQEVCAGQEYTINCFYDRNGRCVSCVPHLRKFVRDGEVCFAQTERVPAFTAIAHQFSDIFTGIWGCICFQGFKDEDGSVKVFEINARFGGGYPVCDYAGGTYARWIIQDFLGIPPDYHDNWREGVRMLRYDEAFFTEG